MFYVYFLSILAILFLPLGKETGKEMLLQKAE